MITWILCQLPAVCQLTCRRRRIFAANRWNRRQIPAANRSNRCQIPAANRRQIPAANRWNRRQIPAANRWDYLFPLLPAAIPERRCCYHCCCCCHCCCGCFDRVDCFDSSFYGSILIGGDLRENNCKRVQLRKTSDDVKDLWDAFIGLGRAVSFPPLS